MNSVQRPGYSAAVHPAAPARGAPVQRRHVAQWLVLALMLGLFYGMPWLRWHDAPLLLFDVEARRIHFFGLGLRTDAVVPLLWLALAGLAALCLVTSLYGRLWCAYACPQTVLTRLHRAVRRVTALNGWAGARAEAVLRHALWAAVSLWTGITFVGYFSPIGELVSGLPAFAIGGWKAFWIAFYAAATWANVLFLHEQVCTYLCPYGRVQPWLTDAFTPSIHYDARRGEPRGARPAGGGSVMQRARGLLDPVTARDYVFRAAHPASAGPRATFSDAHLGDCTDCDACVRACPIGLDIRNGRNDSCIECNACTDACDDTMARNGFPAGLILRTSTARIEQRPAAPFRARPLLFGALTVLFLVLAVTGLLAAS